MSRLEKRRRAPEVKAVGVALMSGALIAYATHAPRWGLLVIAAMGAAAYYRGNEWE